jgi:hypothetical protein
LVRGLLRQLEEFRNRRHVYWFDVQLVVELIELDETACFELVHGVFVVVDVD